MEIDGGDQGESHWDTLCNLSEIPKWGYDESTNGEKFLAKKFEFSGGEIHDFTIYRIERMIDDLWDDDQGSPDIFVLSDILEAYMAEDVLVEWVEGFPMAYPDLDDFIDSF